MPEIQKIIFTLGITLLALNLVGSLLTILDKKRAKRRQWRIPEASLFLLALLGGTVGIYLTMKIIRHKARQPKFMVGLPLLFVLQLSLLLFALWVWA